MGSTSKMSPDSVSSLFPDRPIRPLPKRRLRERLSPDVADTISYPPEPQNNAPLFYYPYNLKNDSGIANTDVGSVVNKDNGAEFAQDRSSRTNGFGTEQDEEGSIYPLRETLSTGAPHDTISTSPLRTPPRTGQGRHQNPQPPPSTASSADGYDSFENTNNKKKRKIPTAGESILNGNHVLHDASVLGVPSPPTTGDEGPSDVLVSTPSPFSYPGNSTNAQGISGPGRGRYGRNRGGRSPLSTLPDSNSAWTAKGTKPRTNYQFPASPTGENTGIISSAIASAEKHHVAAGQENISLLHQQATTKASPANSQFTFTFDSQVPGTAVSWPGSDPSPSHMTGGSNAYPTGDPRDPYYGASSRNSQASLSGPTVPAGLNGSSDGVGKGASTGHAQPKKTRRRGNPLLQQARQRRQQTEYQNYHHPPAPEDMWICEFCEYERIFGRPPEALIRQYEIKDRRRRREEAERRRLLEKAKMKSRKGKKASKLPAKNSASAQDRNSSSSVGHHAPLMGHDGSQDLNSEEFEEDDYYDDDVHDGHYQAITSEQDFEAHRLAMAGHDGGSVADGGARDNLIPVS
ncbi:hypothetical protein BX600DRAFT_313993 [Xylariales sp. PMI_506]|nr:hypothetical protein BX600DRAFT_313993 [Xylariales sp. PMI_506]